MMGRFLVIAVLASCSYETPNAAALDAAAGDHDTSSDTASALCSEPDESTVALFTFEQPGPVIIDATGAHDGAAQGAALIETTGPDGCGRAAQFPQLLGYGVVPDSPDWDLTTGSIELWVRPPQPSVEVQGILTRDSVGQTTSGHIGLFVHPDGFYFVRFQDTTSTIYLCSAQAPTPGVWQHVAINFGPPAVELRVDGIVGDATPTFSFTGTQTCGATDARSLAGNANVWVIGANGFASIEGQANQISHPFSDGALDHVRIRSQRLSF